MIPLFGNTALATVGQEYVADVPIPPNTADMATYVAQMQAAEPDGVVVALPAQDSLNFLTEILAANPEIKAALVSTETDAVREALGDEIADRLVYNDSFVVDEESEVYQQYLADMEAAGFDEVGDFRNDMYAATIVFAEIAEQLPAGQVTAAGVWDLLPTQTEVRTGLTPPINFSAPYPVPNSPIPGTPGLQRLRADRDARRRRPRRAPAGLHRPVHRGGMPRALGTLTRRRRPRA